MNFNFGGSDFHNIVVRSEDGFVSVRTNANNADDVSKWKDIFCAKNNLCFNVHRTYDVQRTAFHKKFICLHGDKRHAGIKKTNTRYVIVDTLYIEVYTKDMLNNKACEAISFFTVRWTLNKMS